VFLAIYLDRLTAALAKPRRRRSKRPDARKATTESTPDQPVLASS
jgi:hypothetical protein